MMIWDPHGCTYVMAASDVYVPLLIFSVTVYAGGMNNWPTTVKNWPTVAQGDPLAPVPVESLPVVEM
jgi:hypothetical protein